MSQSPNRFNVSSVCFSHDTTHFDSEDDYCTGCRNITHCQQQQSYSGLRSPKTLILNQLTFGSIYIVCCRWDLQLAVCIWYKISSDKINFCLAGKNNLSYIIIVRTVPDRDLEIRERGRSSGPLDNGGGQYPKKFLSVLWASWQFGLKIGGAGPSCGSTTGSKSAPVIM